MRSVADISLSYGTTSAGTAAMRNVTWGGMVSQMSAADIVPEHSRAHHDEEEEEEEEKEKETGAKHSTLGPSGIPNERPRRRTASARGPLPYYISSAV